MTEHKCGKLRANHPGRQEMVIVFKESQDAPAHRESSS